MSQPTNSMLKKSFRLRQLLSAIRHKVDIAKTAKDGWKAVTRSKSPIG